ncbi:hypothetical protein SDC9_172054 [bioreactor metagenome]|uniref:Uncharacterized protein n=1 Tax=bioreactor metagenome TaxID=1076179 RepID=A0A645GF49_9ZZZZ
MWQDRPETSGRLARTLAQLRQRRCVRQRPGDGADRVRPRHHPFRPGEQLRPGTRFGRTHLRPDPETGPDAVSRRTGDFQQGGIHDVAGALRRLGVAQVPDFQLRPEFETDGAGVCGRVLPPPSRPGNADRRVDGGAGFACPLRQSALRRDFELSAGEGGRSVPHPARTRYADGAASGSLQYAGPEPRDGQVLPAA